MNKADIAKLHASKPAPTAAEIAARRAQAAAAHKARADAKKLSDNADIVCVVHTEPPMGQMNIDGTIMNFTKGSSVTLKHRSASRLRRFVTLT